MRYSVTLLNAQQGYQAILALWAQIKPALMNGQQLDITVKSKTRSTEQNRLMWSRLNDVAQQVEWYGKKLTAESWKTIFSAGLKQLDVVPNIDGTGFVALGMHTSSMTVKEMTDLIDLIDAFGSERGVRWTDPTRTAETA